jgi:hypothetical protein
MARKLCPVCKRLKGAVVGSFLSVWLMIGAAFILSGGVALLVGGSRDLTAHDADHPQLPRAIVKQLDKPS